MVIERKLDSGMTVNHVLASSSLVDHPNHNGTLAEVVLLRLLEVQDISVQFRGVPQNKHK